MEHPDYQQALRSLIEAYKAYQAAKKRVNECVVAVLKEKYVYPDIRDMDIEWKELGLEP